MQSASDAETILFFAIVASGLRQEKAIRHKCQEIIVILYIYALYIESIMIYQRYANHWLKNSQNVINLIALSASI